MKRLWGDMKNIPANPGEAQNPQGKQKGKGFKDNVSD
jgi:hypothetical protein